MKFPEQRLDLSSFGKGKKILSPYTSWLTVRVLVQLERITFRAVLIFLRTALLVCSESDTFLKNYTISFRHLRRNYDFVSFYTCALSAVKY